MKVQYVTWLHPYTAAGVVCINVVKELVKIGVDVSIHPLNPQNDPVKPQEYPPEVQQALKKGFRDDVINIFFSYPDSYPHIRCKVNVGYTGADSDLWYQTENQKRPEWFCNEYMDYMLTPSDYSRQIMYNCGLKKETFLYPHGIDLDLFKPIKRETSIPFRYIYTGELTQRKGAQDLIRAWIEACGADCDEFKLILRANTHMMYLESDEIRELASKSKNIEIHWKNEGQGDLVSYLNSGNIFLYLSKADWFGMTVFEALATGMPVIATATNGYYEFVKDYIIPVKYKLEDIGNQHPYLKGKWNVADPLFSRLAITGTTNDYKAQSEKAYENAFKIREEFSWKAVTEKYLMPFLEKVDKKHFASKMKDPIDRLKEEFKLDKGIIKRDRTEICKRIPKLRDRLSSKNN